MDPILNKETKKNTRFLIFLVFIALVRELLDRLVYILQFYFTSIVP